MLADLYTSISGYQFAYNNPILTNDPTGLCPTCDADGVTIDEGTTVTDEVVVTASRLPRETSSNPILRVASMKPWLVNRGNKISWHGNRSWQENQGAIEHSQQYMRDVGDIYNNSLQMAMIGPGSAIMSGVEAIDLFYSNPDIGVATAALTVGAAMISKRLARLLNKGGKTILGNDAATLANAGRMIPEKEIHQILIHGHFDNFIIDGVITSPKEVARIMLGSGFRRGTPTRLISCHTGAFSDGAAYQLSRYLKLSVLAPTDKVRVLEGGGYQIFGNKPWRRF